MRMAGIRGKPGPPANQNAFKHGLAGVTQRRANGVLTPDEQGIREDILAGLIADKGGEKQIGTARADPVDCAAPIQKSLLFPGGGSSRIVTESCVLYFSHSASLRN